MWTAALIFVVILVVFTILAELYVISRPMYKVAKAIDGPKLRWFWDDVRFALTLNLENTFTYLRSFANTYKNTYRWYSFGMLHIHITRAEEAEIILSSNKHTDKSIFYHFMKPFLGDGLLISKGRKWAQRRKILTPAFHFNILQQFLKLFQEESQKLVHHLNIQIQSKENVINIPPLASRFTLNTMCECSMGVKLDSLDEPDTYRHNIYQITKLLVMRTVIPWLYSDTIHKILGYRKQLDQYLNPTHSFTRNIIQQRRIRFNEDGGLNYQTSGLEDAFYANRKRRYAMLDTLLEAESNLMIDSEGIREEVDTFTFEGHDTTSSALTFIFLLLGIHLDVQKKVYEEIKSIVEENDHKPLSTSDFNNMTYTDRVLKECLRLYPPVAFISRESSEEITLYGQTIEQGTMIHLHIFDMHRDPKYFPDPEKFDPDRFLSENVENRNPFAYVPFSAGPRNCIGQKFAMLEIKSVLQNILMSFEMVSLTKREDIVFVSDLVLRPKNPIEIQFNPRK